MKMGLRRTWLYQMITYLIIMSISSSFIGVFLLHKSEMMMNSLNDDFEQQQPFLLQPNNPNNGKAKIVDAIMNKDTGHEKASIINDRKPLDFNYIQLTSDYKNRVTGHYAKDYGHNSDNDTGDFKQDKELNNTRSVEKVDSNMTHTDVENVSPPNENAINAAKIAFDRLIVDPINDITAPGEMSTGYSVKPNNLTNDFQWYEDGWKNHGFNQYASDHISLQRTILEQRHPMCLEERYDSMNYLDTSVIIIFYNEALSPLLRTVYSVINHSPPHLLKEVFMVDDHSSNYELQEPLQEFVKKHFPEKVKLLRTPKRFGLMNARLYGTNASTARTVTFLDSHCECTHGWLEPLLQRVTANRTTVAMPTINGISQEDFSCLRKAGTGSVLGGFDWSLHFDWLQTPPRELKRQKRVTDPFWSPTMAGCIFTIDKTFFKELGFYDPEYKLYGAENLEISFKIWMCGGRLELMPCSHVGHMFRKKTPYLTANVSVSFLSEMKNKMRLAEVWMDGYKHYFYETFNYRQSDYGDITERKALRQNLKCHSFEWYLKNIYPEHYLPEDHLAGGRLANVKTGECVDAVFGRLHAGNITVTPTMTKCGYTLPRQHFVIGVEDQRIRCDSLCLIGSSEGRLKMVPCSDPMAQQKWKYEYNHKGRIIHEETSKCLDLSSEHLSRLVLQDCSVSAITQRWRWYSKATRPFN